jgi:ATP-dependent Lon protease
MPRSSKARSADPSFDLLALDIAAHDDPDDDAEAFGALPDSLPLVPIRGSVYTPGMIFPLLVGRDRSVRALDAANSGERRLLLLAAQRSLLVEDPEPDEIYSVGVIAEVMHADRLQDGSVRVMLEACVRVRIENYLQTEPYLLVRCVPLLAESRPEEETTLEALARSATTLFETLVAEGRGIAPEALVSVLAVREPDRLVDTILAHLDLRVEEKQAMLEATDVRERLESLAAALRKEVEIVHVQKHIRSRVEKEMGDHQREFILREQLRAIQQELGERIEPPGDGDEYRTRIEAVGMPPEVRTRALKELDRLDRTPPASPEYGVLRNYLDWLVALPWSAATEDRLDIAEAERILDDDHQGLEKVKERLLEFLAVRRLAGDAFKAPILCFVGPPGVGKTSLGRSVARALGRQFVRISLGGVRDEAEIRGHRRTYVGALPGRILQAMKQAGSRNPVIVLDEIDKLGHDHRGDPSAALLEALDPEQNREFSDHYLEAPFDLSQALFLTTANLLDPIAPALRDRLEVIPFSSYTEAEKFAIASRHLLPRQRESHGLTPEQLDVTDDALRLLIRAYTREAGVRHLEREIGSLCRKIARRVVAGKAGPRCLAPDDLEGLLGKPRYRFASLGEVDELGAATGLAYTETGGDTMTIEVQLVRTGTGAEGRLTLTGQLGDVMKESAQAALTFVRSRLEEGDLGAMVGRDIHVHVPAGAVPKDGPSAGVAIAAALMSAIQGRPVRRQVAMTGEITLRGKVLPVGGIKEKILAAHRAGLTTIVLPAENAKDLDDVPDSVREALRFSLVTHADDALALALNDRATL